MSGKSNKFKNKIKTYNNNNKDSKNYYLIHATYTTKPEKKYPETKCILNNFNIIYVLSTVQKNKLKRQTNNKSQ